MILVTGANGFVGRQLCHCLTADKVAVRQAVRDPGAIGGTLADTVDIVPVGAIGATTEWREALRAVDQVVHLAARVHHLHDSASADIIANYREVNTLGTERLALAAAAAGVRRFVYLSSAKADVAPKSSTAGRAMAEGTPLPPPAPQADPYAASKWEAEQRLWTVAAETGLEVVVVRPPLVYGPGVKANFARLLRLVDRGAPLPLALVRNARSLVFSGNLIAFLTLCLQHPAAAGQTFAVSDAADLSTPELIRKIAAALGKRARLWPCPLWVLRALGTVLGRAPEVDRLCGSLQVDIAKARTLLDWQPPFTVDQGIKATADWYRAQHG